jgi:hypothetical protein
MAPRQLRDARSKACAEKNVAMIQGCKGYLDNLPPYHEEIFRRRLFAEGERLPEDEIPDTRRGTMTWTHPFQTATMEKTHT